MKPNKGKVAVYTYLIALITKTSCCCRKAMLESLLIAGRSVSKSILFSKYSSDYSTAYAPTSVADFSIVNNSKNIFRIIYQTASSLKNTKMKNLIRSFYLLLLFMIAISNPVMGQSMGISNTAITPDASSILEMRTTNKGMLIPRMTTAERNAISSPATGLLVFNVSTNIFNYYNGTQWTEIGIGNGSQNLQQVTDLGASSTNRITVNGIKSNDYLDIASVASPASPGSSDARLYAATDAGFTVMEVKTPSGQSFRFMRDNVVVLKVKEAGGITAGQVVYLSGASGGTDECKLWLGDGSITSFPIGVAVDAGSNNSSIRVMTLGKISGLNTSSFTEGASVYASASTSGGISATEPAHPNFSTVVGIISRSHPSSGEITIVPFITKGTEMGTRMNDFSIGTNTTGAKTLTLKNGFNGVLSANPSANRAWTLPDNTGTVALTADITKAAVGLSNVPNIDATNASNLSTGTIPAGRFGNLTVPIAAINATGSPSSATYLRGDGNWSAVSGGIGTLNTLTAATQTFATGTTGTDFNISSAASTHTFNLPIASGTNTGKLSSADWTTFNNKQAAFTNSAGLAATLSDETGTGLAVFSTSPTLTTPVLGVASATSQTITGTAGAGFIELQTQSGAPAIGPANSIRLFSNAGALSWKRSDGFVRSFTASTITADRTYTLPDASGTIALTSDVCPKWAPVTKSTSVTLTNAENFVLGDCTSGNINITMPASPSDGQEVVIIKTGTNENASITILPNSGQIIGQAQSFWNLTERNQFVSFVYVDASTSWRIISRISFSLMGYRKRGTTNSRYYTSPNTGTSLSTSALVANTLYAMPLVVENSVTIDEMRINVTTTGAGSLRIGIYDDNNNSPDQLLVDAGAISTATTGVKTFTTNLPISLPPGLYWVVGVPSVSCTIRGFTLAGLIPIMGSDASLGTAQGFGYSVAFTYAALPTSFPASPTVRTSTPLPAFFVRYSD